MPPITVMVKPVSSLCNMRCAYCFYADEAARRGVASYGMMSEETLETLVRRVFAYADGEAAFAFQGGEPTLAGARFYARLLELEKRYNTRGLRVSHALQTNGYDMPDELMDILAKGRFLVGVSLDGAKDIHDGRRLDTSGKPTYERVEKTIGRLREKGLDYNILCVVDAKIARRAKECFEALAPHGYLQFIPCMDALDGQKTADSLTAEDYGDFLVTIFDLYETRLRGGAYVSVRVMDNWVNILSGAAPEACNMRGACSPGYLVESDGGVFPCDFYALDEWHMGNIKTQSFFRLAKSEKALRFIESSRMIDANCTACPWYALCRGGCRRDREPFIDGRPGRNRLCEGYRRFFEARIDRLQSLAQWVSGKENSIFPC